MGEGRGPVGLLAQLPLTPDTCSSRPPRSWFAGPTALAGRTRIMVGGAPPLARSSGNLLGLAVGTRKLDDFTLAAHAFSRLADSPLRDAWRDEARDFTPWLFENIEYLSEVLGIELEATDSEVAVDSFSADIMATDSRTGDRVLIENQLESSDHRHLGQILTYLAGIDAKCVIWIAREFQEAHLSALRWLNDHTPEGFAFFAVRLRVVRIGDSPFAPVFEVVEKPNSWERQLGKRASVAESELTRMRQSFWERYVHRHPSVLTPTRDSNVWVPMLQDGSVILSMYVASKTSGMFLRGPRGTDGQHLASLMADHAQLLQEAFGASRETTSGYYYGISTDIALRNEERWDELIDWMDAQRIRYAEIFRSIEARPSPGHPSAT